jgi:hypothetical protein
MKSLFRDQPILKLLVEGQDFGVDIWFNKPDSAVPNEGDNNRIPVDNNFLSLRILLMLIFHVPSIL